MKKGGAKPSKKEAETMIQRSKSLLFFMDAEAFVSEREVYPLLFCIPKYHGVVFRKKTTR